MCMYVCFKFILETEFRLHVGLILCSSIVRTGLYLFSILRVCMYVCYYDIGSLPPEADVMISSKDCSRQCFNSA